MATKKPKKILNPDFRGFVNIQVTEELKKFLKAMEFSEGAFVNGLFKLINEGYSVKFSYDDYNHCFQAVMTGQAKEHADYGVFLSGRGSTPEKAFKQMSYFFFEICGQELAPNLIDKPDGEYDD